MKGGSLIVALAAWALGTGVAPAVTDSDRVGVYREFRSMFDARQYSDALPLAQKLVSLTEEQYGSSDRALVNPLSNLATTQYRLRDFKAAEEAYLRSVKIAEASGGGADRLLLRPLHGLGATYFAAGQYEDASLILRRAVDLSRNLDGLFNPGQMPILEPLTDCLAALERNDEAERAFDYSIRVAESAYGKSDLRVMRPLDRAAHWHEHVRRYTTSRILYARALQIAEQTGGAASMRTVEPLEGIARTYRLEFENGGDSGGAQSLGSDPFAPSMEMDPVRANAERLNPDGETAILLALKAIDKSEPVDSMKRGEAHVELGDWYMSSGVVPKALETYREAWRDFQLGGSTAALSEPRQIAYRPPLASASRSRADRDTVEEHFVVVSFTVAKDGHTADVVVTESDAGESQQKAVTSAVRKALYAPRFEGGEPVETQGVTFRERMLSKKQRAPKD